MTVSLAPAGTDAVPIHVLGTDDVALWAGQQSDRIRTWVEASGFKGAIGSALMIPDDAGHPAMALGRIRHPGAASAGPLCPGCGDAETGARHLLHRQRDRGGQLEQEALGWLLACYSFDRYHENSAERPTLVAPDGSMPPA